MDREKRFDAPPFRIILTSVIHRNPAFGDLAHGNRFSDGKRQTRLG